MKSHPKKSRSFSMRTRNFFSGFLLGIGFVAFIDEAIFHQLLHWHHFYDKSVTAVGLISDGLFHAFSWFATVAALFMYADVRRHHAYLKGVWWGGFFIGAGGFQLYDGIIQHKLMRIHQIRYDVNILPYDLTWNILAFLMVIVGIILMRSNKRNQGGIKQYESQ
ncbi:putative membrane protein [Metabacillus niabensis]|uniref:Membrane protein n=2 Tax=Metabacillus niabensis TaxID=324854 RepID=A0ABT9Z5J4_9BACI|nr:putative membrane protein [Metabacillus niabensis]